MSIKINGGLSTSTANGIYHRLDCANSPGRSIWQSDKIVWVSDFTSAGINQALADLGADGGTVFMPEGTYTITAQVAIPVDNVALVGMGQGTIWDASGYSTDHVLMVGGKNNLLIKDFRINGNAGGGNSKDLISDNNTACTFSTFENLYLYQSDRNGIYLDNVNSQNNNFSNVVADDCDGDGFVLDWGPNWLYNCQAIANGGDGFQIAGSNPTLISCFAEANGDNGLRTAATDGIVLNCIFLSNTNSGVNSVNSRCTWVGNVANGNGRYGFGLSTGINNVVTGNFAYYNGNTFADFFFENSSGNIISNNRAVGAVGRSEYGFKFENVDNSTISHNVTSAHDTGGISLDANSDGNQIVYNNTVGEAAIEIADSGSNSFVAFEGATGDLVINPSGTNIAIPENTFVRLDNNRDTGFVCTTDNNLQVVVGSTVNLEFTGGNIQVQSSKRLDMTIDSPVTFDDDYNSFIQAVADDQIGLWTNGTKRYDWSNTLNKSSNPIEIESTAANLLTLDATADPSITNNFMVTVDYDPTSTKEYQLFGKTTVRNHMSLNEDGDLGIKTTDPRRILPAGMLNTSSDTVITQQPNTQSNDGAFIIDNGVEGGAMWYDGSAESLIMENFKDAATGDILFRTRSAGTVLHPFTVSGDGRCELGVLRTHTGQATFFSSSSAFATTFQVGVQNEEIQYNWPTVSGVNGQILSVDASSNLSWTNAGAGGAHALLSATHTDTTPATPPGLGSIITGQGAIAPFTWTELASPGALAWHLETDILGSPFWNTNVFMAAGTSIGLEPTVGIGSLSFNIGAGPPNPDLLNFNNALVGINNLIPTAMLDIIGDGFGNPLLRITDAAGASGWFWDSLGWQTYISGSAASPYTFEQMMTDHDMHTMTFPPINHQVIGPTKRTGWYQPFEEETPIYTKWLVSADMDQAQPVEFWLDYVIELAADPNVFVGWLYNWQATMECMDVSAPVAAGAGIVIDTVMAGTPWHHETLGPIPIGPLFTIPGAGTISQGMTVDIVFYRILLGEDDYDGNLWATSLRPYKLELGQGIQNPV